MRCPWNTCFLGTKGRKYTKMKRLLAFVFVVTLAFSFAGSASAFSWEKPAQPTPEEIGYSIDVLKCTLVTGAAGSYYYNLDDNAVAVNGADVYWAVKLTVDGPADLIQSTAYADVEISGLGLSSVKEIPLKGLDSGVYYFIPSGAGGYFQKIETIIANGGQSPVLATRCTDTQTAKVTAQVYSERVLGEAFNVGDYDVQVRPFLTELKYESPDSDLCYLRQDDKEKKVYKDGQIYNDTNNQEVLEKYEKVNPHVDEMYKEAAKNSFPDVYAKANPTASWNPAYQFRITLPKDGWKFSLQNKNYVYEHIFVIGGYPCIIPATNGASYNAEDLAHMVYEILQSKLGSIRNAKGETIPGLSVTLDSTVYASQSLVILDSSAAGSFLKEPADLRSLVFTFSADPSYDWTKDGNNIPVIHYHATYENDESKQTKLVTFYQAANPVGTGPAIAQFVLNGDRQVQAVITSEAQWNEYFAAYIQGDDDLGDPNSGTGGTYLRIVDQRPTSFLGDMDAIFDLMAWLDEGEIDSIFDAIDAGEMYMTDENLWEALGYAYRFEDSVSWQASTVPIIVDPLA